jgi:hypothetical protein
MTESPAAGWYADPENDERLRYWDGTAWTGQIRPGKAGGGTAASRGGLSGLAIAGIVVAALAVVAGLVAIILNAGGEPDPTSTNSDGPRTAPEVVAPEGWEVYVSRSGAFEYAYDPDWTDALTPSYEDMLVGTAGLADVQMEVAGSWILDGSQLTGETSLIIVATSDGTTIPGLMELQAESFVRSNAASIESDDYEEILSEGITTANGYDAWRIDYTMTAYETSFTASVVAFRHETTLGFIYVVSLKGFDDWRSDYLAVVDSLVITGPPVSP